MVSRVVSSVHVTATHVQDKRRLKPRPAYKLIGQKIAQRRGNALVFVEPIEQTLRELVHAGVFTLELIGANHRKHLFRVGFAECHRELLATAAKLWIGARAERAQREIFVFQRLARSVTTAPLDEPFRPRRNCPRPRGRREHDYEFNALERFQKVVTSQVRIRDVDWPNHRKSLPQEQPQP